MSLLLNPFDYYIFHFAYHLINPWQQRTGAYVTSWNTVYYVLCCDYIIHFLPTDPQTAVLPVIYYNGKNPLQAIKCSLLDQPTSSGLINAENFTKSKEKAFQKNLDIHHPRNDIWRSETVLTVFTDLWLHSNQVNEPTNTLNMSYTSMPPMRLYPNELPTGEYMRVVRVLIKQLHAFSQSAKADDTHLAELKKIAIPMIQGKFYIFLRNLIHRWPLDGSFRLVLELWLTYIQPWRYPPNNLIKYLNKKSPNPDIEDVALAPQNSVDREYVPFIAENLLTYVVVFQQLLPRFGRVDLTSPKMSLMLYRITKVFDQPNLPSYLKEVEQCVESDRVLYLWEGESPHRHTSNHWSNNLPPLSPTSNWSTNTIIEGNKKPNVSPVISRSSFLNRDAYTEKKWSAIVKQTIFELEGPNFVYKPLFSDPPATEVYDLIIQIKRSIRQAEELVRMKIQEEEKMYSGFWGHIKYFLQGSVSNDEFTLRDRQKVPMYLQVALQNLMDMFNLTGEIGEAEPESPSLTLNNNSFDMSNDFKFLTPERVRERIKQIKYDGDPDLHPIRSTENPFLVRLLYQISSKINDAHGQTFYRLYHQPTFTGRLTRQLLCPPMTVYKYDKSIPGSPRVSTNLPPRISLRFLASYRFLTYLCIGAFFAWLFGYKVEVYFMFLIVVFLLYKSVRALRRDEIPVRHNYPTQGFGNISFNDSF
nr:unnamed protein product [Callosobruchus analis]